ncbi:MAG: L-rhamnose mutarotase [Planctomycetes bacterium]|nr:L-rhamnose mutarotase [Planctomycetota bacterium]
MIRKAVVMSVNPDQYAEYEKRHRPIWTELEQCLRDHGVLSYSIFLHEQTSQLFAYLEIEDEARLAAVADTEICKKWWAHMQEIMPSHADNSPISVDLREVFHLD